jgi:hypothetical protein
VLLSQEGKEQKAGGGKKGRGEKERRDAEPVTVSNFHRTGKERDQRP